MNYIILAVIFSLSGFLLGFGDYGRGSWSGYISISAGLVWLAGLIYAFISGGIVFGLIAIVVSFVIAAITMNIGKAVVTKMRSKQ